MLVILGPGLMKMLGLDQYGNQPLVACFITSLLRLAEPQLPVFVVKDEPEIKIRIFFNRTVAPPKLCLAICYASG